VEALAELTGEFLITARLQDQVVANSKLEREIEIASQIQEMLMPRRLPSLASLEFAAACRPASQVGGDFYVVQELADGRCAFALGDVTGKGVPAALIMAMTRTVFRALGRFGRSPDEVLQQLSDVLYDDLEEVGKFVTVLLGIYDPSTARVMLANAGHSPVLYSAPGAAGFTAIEPLLPPLGVLRELDPPPAVLDLGPGALLVAATDGITEARRLDQAMYGEERLLALLRRQRNETAERILNAVIEDAREFTQGAPQSDDQTLLLLKGR
jgi:sigma-B regulation protein RsbU (phosphoserine phosphatase)